MGNVSADPGQQGAGIDLSQFFQVFFEEARENLDQMEQRLLRFDVAVADDEDLNAIFRCAHSVKGGAATFGFNDVTELTHEMETLLDKLRRRELMPNVAMVDTLLAAGDALKAQLARHQGSGEAAPDTTGLLSSIRALAKGQGQPSARTAASAVDAGTRTLELTLGPLQDSAQADGLIELFSEIEGLGTIEALDAGRDADSMRRFRIVTSSSENDLLDLFMFHVAREQVRLAPCGPGFGFHAGAPGAPDDTPQAAVDEGYGFFDGAPGAPVQADMPALAGVAAMAAPRADVKSAPGPDSSTLRVSVEKVDQLINLVGELVITQAMLAQTSKDADRAIVQQMSAGLADLERNTRDLQEAVMSIRMIPMSLVFNRFPRMLRDLAGKLGKKVELVTIGDATELDKGLVEKITDPLTHLVQEQLRPWHRTAARTHREGQAGARHDHARGPPSRRQHRDRSARRRPRPEP